jgi:hypothetical protein
MIGFLTLLEKEFLRFWKVAFQTVAAPVLTALLYLLIFGHVLDDHVQVHGVGYTSFLIPGLVMMQVLQNAFANSSSSLIQAKITGSIVFVLLPPIPYSAFFAAYVLAAVLRGLMVGLGVLLATVWFVDLKVVAPVWILVFSLLGGGLNLSKWNRLIVICINNFAVHRHGIAVYCRVSVIRRPHTIQATGCQHRNCYKQVHALHNIFSFYYYLHLYSLLPSGPLPRPKHYWFASTIHKQCYLCL